MTCVSDRVVADEPQGAVDVTDVRHPDAHVLDDARGQPHVDDIADADLVLCDDEDPVEDVLFYETLSEIFAFDPATLSRLIEEPSGETLAVALRALKASSADALSILMLMKPAVGLDVATFDSMARFYAALKPEDCRAVIDAARANARHMPLTSPEAFGSNEAARRDFGRRSQRPAAREAKG